MIRRERNIAYAQGRTARAEAAYRQMERRNARKETARVIRAETYAQTVQALKADPIVRDMAAEMQLATDPLAGWTNETGEPSFDFMRRANGEYANRGGKLQAHIGGVAEALVELLEGR